MGETGKVLSADTGKNTVTVSLRRNSACEGCKACMAALDGRDMLMEAVNLCGAKPGDMVEVALRDGYLMRASLIMYGLPLIALVLGAVIGLNILGGVRLSELWALLLGLVCMLAVFLAIRGVTKRRSLAAYAPMAVAISDDETAGA